MADPLSAYVHRGTLVDPDGSQSEGVNKVAGYVWDTGSLSWVKSTGGGGGGGGAVTIVDGGDVTQGALADAAVTGNTAGSVSAKLRGINQNMALLPGIGIPIYDYVSQAQATLTDTWSFKTGGSGGTLVATVTITYTDSTKATISTVAKT